MMRYMISLGCFYILILTTRAQTNPDYPNILLIIADDLGVDATNGYHSSSLLPNTPTLDSLRANGLTFKNTWAAPKCTPSRAAIMSGKYGSKTGVLASPGNLDLTHTSIFKAIEQQTNGVYADAVFGKWHIASNPVDPNHPAQHGIDHFEGFLRADVDDYYNWDKTVNGIETVETEYATKYLTDAAINWVNNQNQPWFLWMAHATPHVPFHVPPAGTYTQSPVNSNAQKSMAMIENMDFEINRLLQSIPTSVKQNTLIVFVGDNGSGNRVLQNFPSGRGKSTIYQGGVHVPMILSGAGVNRINQQEIGLAHVTDIYATLMDVVGANLPGGIYNSFSFYKAFSTQTLLRKYNYTEIGIGNSSDYAVRNDTFKLIQKIDGSQEFYNVVIDSFEINNLINNLSSHEQTIKLALENEGSQIRQGWSCNDGIKNGDETSIDCGGTANCLSCSSTNSNNSTTNANCNTLWLKTCSDVILDTSIIAKHYIFSEHKLSSQNAQFLAGDSIVLLDGFEFDGENLCIDINTCTIFFTGIDDANCPNSNELRKDNIVCDISPSSPNQYNESIQNGLRVINANGYPNHDYGTSNQFTPAPVVRTVQVSANPQLAAVKTSILSPTNRPRYLYGIALNGIWFGPAPATPFIFTNTNTGEYNWDWVFEPTNVRGPGQGFVSLDCANAHSGPQGYHYHGNMFQYIEQVIQPGLSTTAIPPADPLLLGWAADGFPILYRFAPDAMGNLTLLQPSYQLKLGNRPGNGISEPCGSYNGRYTRDYEYVECSGDLDECNGIERTITLTTPIGLETFDYFYVVTDSFPEIGRCFSGTPDQSFD